MQERFSEISSSQMFMDVNSLVRNKALPKPTSELLRIAPQDMDFCNGHRICEQKS